MRISDWSSDVCSSDLIEDATSTPGEMQLSIGEIAGALPQSLVARNVVVSDNEGPWLTISAVEIGWRPWRLLDRTIDVERIELSEIALDRKSTRLNSSH